MHRLHSPEPEPELLRRLACRPTRPRAGRVALALALAVGLPFSASRSSLVAQQPAAAQAPAARQVDLRALDAYFAQARKDWGVPGLAVAIVKDGRVVLAKGYGIRELGKPEVVDENTLFAIASNSKAFTAVALATLVDQGKLTFDTPVRQVLPWFQLYAPYVSEDARVRDLLSHRIGLRTFGGDLLWYGTTYSSEDVARRTRFLKQAAPYRSSYGYSNVMFVTAGQMIPALTGRSWTDYVASTILAPLGMTRTVTSIDSLSHRGDVATPHAYWRGNLQPFPWRSWNSVQAAGGIISSAADMAKWLRLLAGRGAIGGDTLVRPATLRALWTPQVSFGTGIDPKLQIQTTHLRGYGMGFNLADYRGRFVASHGGAADGMFSQLAVVPEEGLGVVVLTNSTTALSVALVNRVLDEYLSPPGAVVRDWSAEQLPGWKKGEEQELQRRQEYVKAPASPRPPQPLAAYAGTYGGDLYGDATVAVEGQKLVLRLLPAPEMVADLTPLDGDRFLLEWRAKFPWFDRGIAQFVTDGRGKVTDLKLDVPNQDFWFDELPLARK